MNELVSADVFGKILERLEEVIFLADEEGRILSITPGITKITGFKPEKLISKGFVSLVHPEDIHLARKIFLSPQSVEIRLIGKEGLRVVRVQTDILSKTRRNLVLGIIKDITDYKGKIELLTNLEEKTHTGIYIVQEGKFVYVNRKLADITGYDEEELLQMNPFDLVHPEHLSFVRERYYKREKGEEVPERYEWRIITKNGEEKWVEVIATRMEFKGRPAVLGNVFDITHRKLMEEKLRRSEEKYRSLLEAIEDIMFVLDTEGKFLFLNKKFEELTFYSRNEWIGRSFSDLLAPEYRETTIEKFRKGIAGSEIPLYEVELIRKDGRRIFVELNVTNLCDGKNVVGRIGIARDISDRKDMENKILESEEMFRKLAEKSLVGIYLIQDGVFRYVNPKMAELWGYGIDELIGRNPIEFVHPADRELVERNLKLRIEGEVEAISYNLRIVRKDGEVRINKVYGSRIYYRGRPAVIGTLIDITESEKYREELERYERFYKNAHDLFFILDSKARFIEVNPRYAELLGYRKEELIGHTARRLMDPEEIGMVREMFRRVMEGSVVRYEAKAIPKGRRRVYQMEVILWPVFENGKVVGAEGIVRDITERKKLEEDLRRGEEKYRKTAEYLQKLIEVAPIPIISWDSRYRITLWNKAAEKHFGWKVEDVLGRGVLELQVPEEERERVKKVLDGVEEGKPAININPTLTKNGERKIFEWYNFALGKGDEKITTGIGIDLTERIEMEKNLVESEEKFRKLYENSPNMIAIIDEDGTFIEANPAMVESIGFNPVGMKLKDVFPGDIAEKRLEKVKEAIRKNRRVKFDDSRENRYFSNILHPLSLKGKRYCFVVSRDVTRYLRLNTLLNAINEINKLIVYEKDLGSMIEKACGILSALEEHYSVWVGLVERDRITRFAGGDSCSVDLSLEKLPQCFAEAMKSAGVVKKKEMLARCPFQEGYSCTIVPMRIEGRVRGFVVIHSRHNVPEEGEVEMLQTLVDDLAFAIKTLELEESRKKAYQQIESNIEQFAILVDQIRNPLAIIAGLAELKANEELRKELTEQVERIDRLIGRLDRGWLESERIREFLRRTSK